MNQIIKNTIILFVITLVAGICLGTVHDITLDPIAQAQEAAATKTYQEVYPDAASFDEPQELADAVTAAADSISEIFAMFRSNIRTKYESSGDLMAQIAANNVGEKRFEELCDEMGVEVVLEAIAELENYCDRRMRAELEKLPKRTFEFED